MAWRIESRIILLLIKRTVNTILSSLSRQEYTSNSTIAHCDQRGEEEEEGRGGCHRRR